jgi:3-phenylpropionate/trans-cinnamate dioxygenase ferredoxin subunit
MTGQGAATVTVCSLDEIPSGTVRKVTVGGVDVALVRIEDSVYALADECSHGHVSLSGGEVWCDELELECPKHGSTFSLIDGEPSTLPATQPVAVYDASVVDGNVVVTVNVAGDIAGHIGDNS